METVRESFSEHADRLLFIDLLRMADAFSIVQGGSRAEPNGVMAGVSDVIGPSAVGADQPAGEGVICPRSFISEPCRVPLADLLYPLELLPADDCRMMVPHQILRHLTLIFPAFMGQKIRGVGLLQERVPAVPFQGDHPGDHRRGPSGLDPFLHCSPSPDLPLRFSIVRGRDMLIIQPPCDIGIPFPILHFLKDPPDDGRFFLNDLHTVDLVTVLHRLKRVLPFSVTVSVNVIVPGLPLGIAFLGPPADVGGDRAGFLLGNGGKGGEYKIAGGVCGIQPFLFKQDGHLMLMQGIERCHEITGVPGKPGDGFAHDAVDLPFPAMPQEPLVAGPVLFIRTGDPVIGIDARADPFRVPG